MYLHVVFDPGTRPFDVPIIITLLNRLMRNPIKTRYGLCSLTLRLTNRSQIVYSHKVDQDQNAQNVWSDLGSTLSDEMQFVSEKRTL